MNEEYEAEEGECIEFHHDGICTCGTFRVSSPDIENGKEFTMKSRGSSAVAEQFVRDHDDDSSFAHNDEKVEVTVINEQGEEETIEVLCEVEFKYFAI